MSTIIVSAPLPGSALERLRQAGHKIVVGQAATGLGRDGFIDHIKRHPEVEALISLLSDSIDRSVLDAAPALRVVANYAVGVDNLDLKELASRGLVATNTPGVLTEASADLSFALLLDACRNVTRGDRLVRSGGWHGWAPSELLGVRVTGATLGIVGLGRIGQAMARRARGFDMKVLYWQRHRADAQIERELGCSYVQLDELIEQSDIVSLHCPLTEATRGLLGRDRLGRMKRGAVLVNAARGPVVDEEALAEALSSGHLFAAGLDVYAQEPQVHPALLALPNVVLAPHLGSADQPTRERMAHMCADAVLTVLAGGEPKNRVA